MQETYRKVALLKKKYFRQKHESNVLEEKAYFKQIQWNIKFIKHGEIKNTLNGCKYHICFNLCSLIDTLLSYFD